MSFRSMFQDVRDAVDWVHYKVTARTLWAVCGCNWVRGAGLLIPEFICSLPPLGKGPALPPSEQIIDCSCMGVSQDFNCPPSMGTYLAWLPIPFYCAQIPFLCCNSWVLERDAMRVFALQVHNLNIVLIIKAVFYCRLFSLALSYVV